MPALRCSPVLSPVFPMVQWWLLPFAPPFRARTRPDDECSPYCHAVWFWGVLQPLELQARWPWFAWLFLTEKSLLIIKLKTNAEGNDAFFSIFYQMCMVWPGLLVRHAWWKWKHDQWGSYLANHTLGTTVHLHLFATQHSISGDIPFRPCKTASQNIQLWSFSRNDVAHAILDSQDLNWISWSNSEAPYQWYRDACMLHNVTK